MKRFLSSFFDIRKGEVKLTLLMVIYYYLLLVTYYFLKPARDSLFLVKLGATQLPIVFILIAFVVVPVTTLYGRASRNLKINKLLQATTAAIIGSILLLRWLLQYEQAWIFYVFYIWVSIYGILMTSQYWLFANAIFDSSQAKRVFALIGLGGILGATTGGEVTNLFVKSFNIKTENLLFICIGLLIFCALLANIIWVIRKRMGELQTEKTRRWDKSERNEQTVGVADMFRTVIQSRHLLLIVGIISMTMATASFVDYQFKTVSVVAFPAKEDLTGFLGQFYGRLSLISFFLQFLFANRVLKYLGVGGAILFLPIGLLFGSMFMIAVPGLLAGVLLRGADGVFKYSIDKTGRELLFLPVPLQVKKRTKLFIDMFVDRWFRGIAGGLLLLFTLVLGFSVRQISFVVLVMLAIWLFIALVMRKEYVNAFRKALEKREIDPEELRINLNDASTLATLTNALRGDNERQLVYALNMLDSVEDKNLIEHVRPLLAHDSSDVKIGAIQVLLKQREVPFQGEIESLLKDTDPDVRLAALEFLCEDAKHTPGGPAGVFEIRLKDTDPYIQAAAVVCAAKYGGKETETHGVIDSLLQIEGTVGEVCRIQVAKALGHSEPLQVKGYFLKLLEDSSPDVVKQTILSAGLAKERELVPFLLEMLADRRYRAVARSALAGYGNRILGTLFDYLRDESVPFIIRTNIPRILSHIPTQQSVDMLTQNLTAFSTELEYQVLKALNRLRTDHPELKFRKILIKEAIIEESKSYYQVLQILYLRRKEISSPEAQLLEKALAERLDRHLERLFRLLGLHYGPSEIYGAYLGFVSDKKTIQANAVEFLDNLLAKDLKKYLSPILDQASVESVVSKGRDLFHFQIRDLEEALEYLMNGRSPWLRACAIYNVRDLEAKRLLDLVREAQNDSSPIVRETARIILEEAGA